MSEHLSQEDLNALADGELSSEQQEAARSHFIGCHSCTNEAFQHCMLKSATARAGHRYTPSSNFQERIARGIRDESAMPQAALRVKLSSPSRLKYYGWAVACTLALVFAGIFVMQSMARRSALASSGLAALSTEVCDQHIAASADGASLQVISSDRHTVKPWFQGKLPFSFNLPENLPSGITLDGANLTYIQNRPTAQLIYSIGKHRVSVYLQQADANALPNASLEQSGFHIVTFSTGELEGFAASDVDPSRLLDLTARIAQIQPSPR